MRTWMGLTSVAAVFFAAAGCAPAAEPVGAEPVGASQAEPAGNALSASAEESAGNYGDDDGSGAFGGGACVITGSEGVADVDADGIPDEGATFTISNCPAEERGGIVNASYAFQDTNVEAGPATLPFNFTVDGDFNVTADDGQGLNGSITVSKSVEGRQTANSIGASDEVSVEASLEGPNRGFSSSESYAWDTTYTMTTATFGDGTLALSGEWDIEFKYHEGEDEYRAYANSVVTSEGITLEADCPTHIVAGTLSAEYEAGETGGGDGNAKIVVTWTACGVSNATWSADAAGPDS